MKHYFCVGSYNAPILFGTGEVFHGKGKGLSIGVFEDGKISLLASVPIPNPSYLCIDKRWQRIYAVNELKEFQGKFGGGVTELSFQETGKGEMELNVIRSLCTGGADPCHITVSENRDYLLIANYASGSLTAFSLDKNGHILPEGKVFQHSGHGPNPGRQSSPHAHSTVCCGKDKLLSVDLGTDRLWAYRIGKDGLMPEGENSISVSPGSGPRLGEFSPDGRHFYLVNELSASVTHFQVTENGQFTERETVPGVPGNAMMPGVPGIAVTPGVPGNAILPGTGIGKRANYDCADLHIHPSGRFLFLSIRGLNGISSFQIGNEGELHWMETVSCQGKTPRNFAFDPEGRYLLAANQDSDAIAVFSVGERGGLTFNHKVEIGAPVCVRFF